MRYKQLIENYSPDEDKSTPIKLDDTRKVRLTLAHLSKLRKIREYRKYEDTVRSELVQRMYGGAAAPGDEAGMDGDLGL